MLGSFEQHREGKETTVVAEGGPGARAVLASASSATAG